MANAVMETGADAKRLLEIVKVISKYKVTQGVSPEKLCDMFKELGPTFVKLGQLLSMHPEIIPMEHCKKLESLRTDASRLVTAQIREIITEEYGRPWSQVFKQIMPYPLGAASIAQVHEAVLLDGTHVAVKIQRPEIYSVMERDVRLLKSALNVIKLKKINNVMDLGETIDEVWAVAQEEMDFEREAANIRRVRENIEGIKYVYCPKVYDELSTKHILVMEYIGGFELTDKAAMEQQGYDVQEVCTKFINNYIKQFAEDRFFHADPHPGNLRVRDGKIVWLDMGMMGTLTERERKLVGQAVSGVARGDVGLCRDAVLGLGEFRGKTDKRQLYRDIEGLLDQYGTADLGSMDLAKVFEDLTDVMKRNGISMPSSLTMLARGLATIEGVVADLSPEINVMNVVTARMGSQLLHSIDWRGEIVRDAQAVYASAHKSLEIPSLMADILRTGLKGEANLGVEHHVGDDMARLMQDVVLKLCAALVAAALLVCGALLRDVAPLAGGLSWLTVFCFLLSAALLGWAFVCKDQKK